MGNPFSMTFGLEPSMLVSRVEQRDEIVGTFTDNVPANRVYILTGVRGSGKTVMLTEISDQFREDPSWIVVDVNPERDMLQGFAGKLCSIPNVQQLLEKSSINLSLLGLGITVEGAPPIADIEAAITRMLERLDKSKKRVLIAVDDVSNNEYMRVFTAAFQIFLREKLPVYMLMTGLYENVESLQNEKGMTFLLRAPKVSMRPLSMGTMAEYYARSLETDMSTAIEMAHLTMGYPYAFQTLGFLCWKHKSHYKEVLTEYKLYLEEYVYRKIWSELSRKDKMIARGIASVPDGRIKVIREQLQLDTNAFNPYRERLIIKGIIDGSEYGHVKFTLPFFDEFVLAQRV